MATVKVKIMVAVDDNGEWTAAGFSGDKDDPRTWVALDDLSDNVTFHWVEADIPIPLPQTFLGRISEAGKL